MARRRAVLTYARFSVSDGLISLGRDRHEQPGQPFNLDALRRLDRCRSDATRVRLFRRRCGVARPIRGSAVAACSSIQRAPRRRLSRWCGILTLGLTRNATRRGSRLSWANGMLSCAGLSGSAPGEIRTPDLRFRRATTTQSSGEVTPLRRDCLPQHLAKRPTTPPPLALAGETDAKSGNPDARLVAERREIPAVRHER